MLEEDDDPSGTLRVLGPVPGTEVSVVLEVELVYMGEMNPRLLEPVAVEIVATPTVLLTV